MFMSFLAPDCIGTLTALSDQAWQNAAARWEQEDAVVLFDEAERVLCLAVCTWAGIPLPESELATRSADISAVIDSTGGLGPRHWRGRLARKRADAWLTSVIERVRAGEIALGEDAPAYVIAWHRDPAGELLDAKTAAVELFNVVRPTVAIARFVTFAALALHEHPECHDALSLESGDTYLKCFIHEVRRFYPFFPFVTARVRKNFEWRGHPFKKGRRVLLDLYGTNHDPRVWQRPDEFRPERFRGKQPSPFELIPQGGGDHFAGHRCAGEWVTTALMAGAVRFLTRTIRYDVPAQDLNISLSRAPAIPRSRFIMRNVRPQPAPFLQAP